MIETTFKYLSAKERIIYKLQRITIEEKKIARTKKIIEEYNKEINYITTKEQLREWTEGERKKWKKQ